MTEFVGECEEITREEDPVRYCGAPLEPVGDPVFLEGTGTLSGERAIVQSQRVRCAVGHWYDDMKVVLDGIPI